MSHFVEKTYWDILHKKLQFSISLFLDDILDETPLHPIGEYFDIKEIGDMIRIIPLFYCNRIISDGDGIVIDSHYMIIVPRGYKHIISFIGEDNQDIHTPNISYRIDNEVYVTVRIENRVTGELIPNMTYKIKYENYPDVIKSTGYNGFGGFIMKENFQLEVVE